MSSLYPRELGKENLSWFPSSHAHTHVRARSCTVSVYIIFLKPGSLLLGYIVPFVVSVLLY